MTDHLTGGREWSQLCLEMAPLRIVLVLIASLGIAWSQNAAPLILPPQPGAATDVIEATPASEMEVALYLTAWDVTREVILNPAVLNEEMDFGWSADEVVTPEMRAAVSARIVSALASPCDLIIDSELAEFTQQGVQFIEPDIDNFLPLGEAQSALMEDFRIVVKGTTPLPSLQSALMLRWDYFPGGLSQFSLRIADTLGSRERLITPATGYFQVPYKLASNLRDAPEPPPIPELKVLSFPWIYVLIAIGAGVLLLRRRWLPAVLCVALGASFWAVVNWRNQAAMTNLGLVDAEEGKLIADRILEGVYHGYNFRDEETQYDVLAQVLAEPALTEVFLETNRTVESRQREGSQVQVQAVTVLSAETTPLEQSAGFAANCQWRTRGQIGHWGHFHDRSNLFTADLQVEVRDGKWKATSFALRNRERE